MSPRINSDLFHSFSFAVSFSEFHCPQSGLGFSARNFLRTGSIVGSVSSFDCKRAKMGRSAAAALSGETFFSLFAALSNSLNKSCTSFCDERLAIASSIHFPANRGSIDRRRSSGCSIRSVNRLRTCWRVVCAIGKLFCHTTRPMIGSS